MVRFPKDSSQDGLSEFLGEDLFESLNFLIITRLCFFRKLIFSCVYTAAIIEVLLNLAEGEYSDRNSGGRFFVLLSIVVKRWVDILRREISGDFLWIGKF